MCAHAHPYASTDASVPGKTDSSFLHNCWVCLALYSVLHTPCFRHVWKTKLPGKFPCSWKLQSCATDHIWLTHWTPHERVFSKLRALFTLKRCLFQKRCGLLYFPLMVRPPNCLLRVLSHTIQMEIQITENGEQVTYLSTNKTHQVLTWSSMQK